MVSFDICEGNPGALTFLMLAYNIDLFKAESAFQRMQDNNITGCKLYMLWNDCCDRNTELTLHIMLKCSILKIIEHINYDNGRGFAFSDEELKEVEQ